MSRADTAHVFNGVCGPLVGVLSHPAQPSETGLLVIVGGPQYRVGSHRQFVALARSIAATGHEVLRFDYSGMGDSCGAVRDFQAVSEDVEAAINFMFAQLPRLRQVVLWGLCDGASAALLYCHDRRDPRVAGLCLVNPWVRSAHTLARTRVKHYYLQRLRQLSFWRKLLSGQVAHAAVTSLVDNLRKARQRTPASASGGPFQDRMASAWLDTSRPILLLLSGDDLTAREFIEATASHPAWTHAMTRPALSQRTVANADHTFSDPAHQRSVEILTTEWLGALVASTAGQGANHP